MTFSLCFIAVLPTNIPNKKNVSTQKTTCRCKVGPFTKPSPSYYYYYNPIRCVGRRGPSVYTTQPGVVHRYRQATKEWTARTVCSHGVNSTGLHCTDNHPRHLQLIIITTTLWAILRDDPCVENKSDRWESGRCCYVLMAGEGALLSGRPCDHSHVQPLTKHTLSHTARRRHG